jgi:type VI secretion system lysozyme-like protein
MRDPRPNEPLTLGEDPHRLTQSVLENLSQVLNTRLGDSKTDPKFGLPDLAAFVHSLPEGIDVLATSIKDMIESYEPRIGSIRVRYIGADQEDLILKFEVKARLQSGEHQYPLKFQTIIASTGEFRLNEP